MAIVFPTLEDIKKLKVEPTNGEWYLLNYLADNLSDEIEIYYEPFLNGDRPDIVLMQQHCGVTIVEVKDWDLNSYYLDNVGNWYLQNEKHMLKKSPFKQVFQYKDNMFNLHINGLLEKKILNKKFYGRINAFVYFHNASQPQIKQFYESLIANNNPYQTNKLLKQRDFYTKTKETIQSIILPKKNETLFPDSIYKEFHRYLQPPFHTAEQGKDIHYTKKQQELSISKSLHQKIKGVAGSGKTLILAKRAVNAYKRNNENVLILTFNITLTSYIHDMISNVREDFGWNNFTILNYHHFFNMTTNNYGLKIENLSDYDDENYFEDIKNDIYKYQSIFIDEIQDYKVEWIRLLKRYFLADNGELVVLGDEKQNLYDRKLDDNKKPNTTIPSAWNLLRESFRLDTKIADIAENFQKEYFQGKYEIDNIQSSQGKQSSFDFESNVLKTKAISNDESMIVSSIFEIIKKYDIHPNDICILAYNIKILREIDHIIRHQFNERVLTTFETKEVLAVLEKEHSDKKILKSELDNVRRVKKIGFRLNNGMIKISTIQSFKGWEIPTLFLIIDDNVEEAIYTAITRARQNLIIFDRENGKYYKFFHKQMYSN